MAQRIILNAADGHTLEGWHADAGTEAIGGIVILQAIYGLTSHLGDVCDLYASGGISAIAPALYDRSGRDIVFGYDKSGLDAGMAQRETLAQPTVLVDVAAALDRLRASGPVAVQGFCTGGTWAWVAAAELDLDAAVIYYGSDVYENQTLQPRCPTILHYGDQDPIVPFERVEELAAGHKAHPMHIYPGAGHAFFNPEQTPYNKAAADLAHFRTLEFLRAKFG
jgi:carboxymethylenebutenolidase